MILFGFICFHIVYTMIMVIVTILILIIIIIVLDVGPHFSNVPFILNINVFFLFFNALGLPEGLLRWRRRGGFRFSKPY